VLSSSEKNCENMLRFDRIRAGYKADTVQMSLCESMCSDLMYQEAFVATYRTFVDPSQLIKKLLYRYSLLSNGSDRQKRKLANNTFSLLVRVVSELW